jgi:hypothetical protein
MFDSYVSLGENCEIAFQMRRVLRRDESSFFGWNITSFSAFECLVDCDFQGIMQPENFRFHGSGDLVRDLHCDYLFHSDFPRVANVDFAAFPEIIAAHRSKAQYLVEKFYETARTGGKVVYFYKTPVEDARDKAPGMVERLLKASEGRENFRLVIVQTADRAEPDWNMNLVSNRYVRRFAPYDDAHDGHVSTWDRIFAEFPHAQGLQLAGY